MTESTTINNITSSIVTHTSDDEVKLIYDRYEKLFRCGDTAYVEERYDDAIQLYSTVLQPDTVTVAATHIPGRQDMIHLRFQCYLHRSIAYQQVHNYTLALTDIENAIQLLFDNNVLMDAGTSFIKAYEIHVCYRQYGIIAYQLQKYKDAQNTFEKILRETLYDPNDTKYNEIYYQNYIQQCQQQHQPQEQPLPVVNESISMDNASSPATTTTTTLSSTIDSIKTNDVKINPATLLLLTPKYQYYQNDTHMVIQILEPNVVSSNMIVQYIDTQNILVSIQKHGHSITIIHGELYDTILPEKCSIVYKSDKVVIKLRKERPNYEWQTLLSESNKTKKKKKKTTTSKNTKVSASQLPVPDTTDTTSDSDMNIRTVPDDASKTKSTTTPKGTVLPKTKIPTPYASHRDWDAIEKDVEEEIAKETPVGDAAMNQLFQQIYQNADDDTKRAMIKSYQTSGGTVLSTNWNEVAQKDYEHKDRIAPDGQEWKTWEGEKLTK